MGGQSPGWGGLVWGRRQGSWRYGGVGVLMGVTTVPWGPTPPLLGIQQVSPGCALGSRWLSCPPEVDLGWGSWGCGWS